MDERIDGQYTLRDELGRGRFGRVWRAWDHYFEREVALKLLEASPEASGVFVEAARLEQYRGPHVLRVLNTGSAGDVSYLVTDIADGGSAEKVLQDTAAGVAPHLAHDWIKQALTGLQDLHDGGLLHRDAKPGNVFLHGDRALIGDFGVAYLMDAQGRSPAGGDPLLWAPEAFRQRYMDAQTEVWAAGVSLYRLLTGEWPFEGASLGDLSRAVRAGTPRPVRHLAPHVPRVLSDRVRRALAVERANRYASAGQMTADLGRIRLRHRWSEGQPHAGHRRCWRDNLRGLEVCCFDQAAGIAIEARRQSATAPRIRPACRYGLAERQLAVELTRVFDALN